MSDDLDATLAPVFRRQHGALALRNVHAAGGSTKQAWLRVQKGSWLAGPDEGTYLHASSRPTRERQLMVATLGHPKAVVAGRAAVDLLGVPEMRVGRPAIAVPRGTRHVSKLAVTHRSRFIYSTQRLGIPVMRIEQCIIDLAAELGRRELTTLVDNAINAHVLDIARLGARYVTVANSRLPGVALVRDMLDLFDDGGYVPPATELERLLYGVLDRPGMLRYERQATAPWWSPKDEQVDALIPAASLIVEADGRRWHTRLRDFENDRRRDNLAAAHGHLVQRFWWQTLRDEPDEVEALIRSATRARTLPGQGVLRAHDSGHLS